MPFCLTVRVEYIPADHQGLANVEGAAFDQLAIDLDDAICRAGIGLHAATITVRGIRLFAFYCREPLNGDQLLRVIVPTFDLKRVMVRCERDEAWSFYRAIA